MSRPRAAVDSGSNSTRLLIVDATGQQVLRRSEITRLGQGVDATGHLADEAIARTVAVVAEYRDQWTAAGVAPEDVRIAATAAVRDAANRDRYLDAVRDRTGVRVEVVTGEREAALSFAGVATAVNVPDPVLLVDIGGGSTELVVGRGGQVQAAHSMQVGAVRVTERHLHGDPPAPAEATAARAMIATVLADADQRLAAAGASLDGIGAVVGVAGTITTLAAVSAGLGDPGHPDLHGMAVATSDITALTDRLLAMPVALRRALPGLPTGRADVIAGGALVLAAVLARVGATSVTVSLADNLDGLIAEMA